MPRRFLLVATLIVTLAVTASVPARAATPATEELQYVWRLRGGLAWIAGLRFPTRGTGALRNVFPSGDRKYIESELVIRSDETAGSDYYKYQSHIDAGANRTLMTFHGYSWGGKARYERTSFDYGKSLATTREENGDRVKDKVETIPSKPLKDILTGIHYLRENGNRITEPILTEIYSDGTLYPVQFRPKGRDRMTFQGKQVPVRIFEITAAPSDQKRWPGGIRVWLTDDSNRIPMRIEIHRGVLATLQLDLRSVASAR